MECIKEFLESSTIHGLIYISSIRTPLIKLFWIAVVIAGFITASILINRSFSDWEKSPIATSIETFSISKSSFPKVTVCPPKGTGTPLNYGLVKIANITQDKKVKNELIKLTRSWFDDAMLDNVMSEENAFKDLPVSQH